MSTGFRIFLLSLLLFGAVWIYRFRSVEIDQWLRQAPPPLSADAREPLISQVDRIPGLDEPLTLLRLQGQGLAFRTDSERRSREPSSLPLSDEERLVSADLPLFEGADGQEAEPFGETSEEKDGAGGEESRPREAPADSPSRKDSAAPREGSESRPLVASAADFDEILYTVQAGDSLWKIAQNLLGEGTRYHEIREINQGALGEKKLDCLLAGTLLKVRIPASKSPSIEKARTPQASGTLNRYIR